MVILGIDPGIATTGWGIIKTDFGNKISVKGFGAITTYPKDNFPTRLGKLYKDLNRIIKEFKPGIMAVEELFFAKNTKTALCVGQARGVIILSAVQSGLEVAEYTPLEVKQAIAGYGRADKFQMQGMVKSLLGLKDIPKPDDAADALAVAMCYCHSQKINDSIKNICLERKKECLPS